MISTLEVRELPEGAPAALGSGVEPVPPGFRCWSAERGGVPVAHIGAGLLHGLVGAEGFQGVLGWYEAADAEAGLAVLEAARHWLAERGAGSVVGPINGTTWSRYRWALPPRPEDAVWEPATFAGDVTNPPAYPAHWEAAGLVPVAHYESRIVLEPRADPDRLRVGVERASAHGVRVRALDPAHWDDELADLHGLSLAAFAANPFYTPIGLAAFRDSFARTRSLLDPELVRLAHGDQGELLGVAFAYPDPLSGAGGRAPRVVLKTLATHPGVRGLRLATLLTEQVHQRAAERGAPAVIHALMHLGNRSAQMSEDRDAEVFRRYALFGTPERRP